MAQNFDTGVFQPLETFDLGLNTRAHNLPEICFTWKNVGGETTVTAKQSFGKHKAVNVLTRRISSAILSPILSSLSEALNAVASSDGTFIFSISEEAERYLLEREQGGSFAYERLLMLPQKDATRILSQGLLLSLARLVDKPGQNPASDLKSRTVAEGLVADSLPFRYFTPVKELRELIKPLIFG